MKSRSKKVTELGENCAYFFEDPLEYEEKAAKKRFCDGAEEALGHLMDDLAKDGRFTAPALEEIFQALCDRLQISAGKLIHPTRLAVSGVSFGPGLFELMSHLGQETVLRRLQKAVSWMREQGVHA
jgi:glutamyl-tRNA synthetase